MEALARKNTPEDERLLRLGLVRQINDSHGGAVLSVWDVDDLPQDWVEFFTGLQAMPRIIERQKKIDAMFKMFEENHPQYGKRQ